MGNRRSQLRCQAYFFVLLVVLQDASREVEPRCCGVTVFVRPQADSLLRLIHRKIREWKTEKDYKEYKNKRLTWIPNTTKKRTYEHGGEKKERRKKESRKTRGHPDVRVTEALEMFLTYHAWSYIAVSWVRFEYVHWCVAERACASVCVPEHAVLFIFGIDLLAGVPGCMGARAISVRRIAFIFSFVLRKVLSQCNLFESH